MLPSGADLKRLRAEHVQSIVPLQALAAEARGLERQAAEWVNAAYGLTPEEVAFILVPKQEFGNALLRNSVSFGPILSGARRETGVSRTDVPKQEFGNEGPRGGYSKSA